MQLELHYKQRRFSRKNSVFSDGKLANCLNQSLSLKPIRENFHFPRCSFCRCIYQLVRPILQPIHGSVNHWGIPTTTQATPHPRDSPGYRFYRNVTMGPPGTIGRVSTFRRFQLLQDADTHPTLVLLLLQQLLIRVARISQPRLFQGSTRKNIDWMIRGGAIYI